MRRWWWWGRAARSPACAVPPSPQGASRGGGRVGRRRWAPGPTRLPVLPCRPPRAARLPARVHVSCPSRDAGVCRVWLRAVCSRGRAVVALPPPCLAAFPRPGENRGISSSLPSGAREGPRLAGLISPSGADVFGGTAVGRVRRDVGRRDLLPLEGLRRSASVCPHRSLCVMASSRGSREAVGSGSARRRGCGGTARGACGVIPAGLSPRARSPPERAVCRSLVEALSGGGLLRAALPSSPAFVLPCRSPSPSVAGFSLSPPSPRLDDPWPCCRTPRKGGGRAGTGPGGQRGLGARWGKKPAGGWEKLRFGGRPGPAAAAAFLRCVLGGCVRGGVRVACRPFPSSSSVSLAMAPPGFTVGPSSSASRRVCRSPSGLPPSPVGVVSPACSRSPDLAWRVRGVSRVPGVAPRCRVLGGGLLRPRPPVSPAASRRRAFPTRDEVRPRRVACTGACPTRGGSTRVSWGSDGWPFPVRPRVVSRPPVRPAARPSGGGGVEPSFPAGERRW